MDNYELLFTIKDKNLTNFKQFINQIYYINLDYRQDRNIHIVKQLEKHNLQATKISGKKGKIGLEARLACKNSHLSIIKKASSLCLSNVCILEDDAVFDKNFLDIADSCINNLPKNWDMLFLGHCFSSYEIKISRYLFIAKQIFCTHCYCINKKAYSTIIKTLESNNKPIDHNYNYLSTNRILNIYMCNPTIVYQIPNKSDIGEGPNKFSNYITND